MAEPIDPQGGNPRGDTSDAALKRRHAAVSKIFPLNLTAEAEYLVPGNPVVSRLEDSVANCFPGLEIDVRGLDRRFFPGLVFEFVGKGARLEYLDIHQDPELSPTSDRPEPSPQGRRLFGELSAHETKLSEGHWFIKSLQQGEPSIDVSDFTGMEVWRFIRGLAAEDPPVTITLKQRADRAGERPQVRAKTCTITGWRRRFTDIKRGVISSAYQPGELTQGLCSPWQHDFRDCACHYWAANHPDVVLPEAYPGEQSDEPELPLDWLRVQHERGRQAEARETFALNRPFQLDHFQINHVWQELRVVLEGREIDSLYVPPTAETADPFESPRELARWLKYLAQLELALSFEYLYARYSLRGGDELGAANKSKLAEPTALARRHLLLIASSEMQHLRWSNQILWELARRELIPAYQPVLDRALLIPRAVPAPKIERDRSKRHQVVKDRAANLPPGLRLEPGLPPEDWKPGDLVPGFREADLRSLTLASLDEFTALEHRSQFIDAAYSRVVATLREPGYPPSAVELALRIVSDGVQHEKHFRQIRQALESHFDKDAPHEAPWLRSNFKAASKGEKTARAERALEGISTGLQKAYLAAAAAEQLEASAGHVGAARVAMTELGAAADDLAKLNLGVPFFEIWDSFRAQP